MAFSDLLGIADYAGVLGNRHRTLETSTQGALSATSRICGAFGRLSGAFAFTPTLSRKKILPMEKVKNSEKNWLAGIGYFFDPRAESSRNIKRR